MTTLLEIRENLKNFYSRYDRYLFIVIRFIIGIIALNTIAGMLGSGSKLESTPVVLALALLCGVLGSNFLVIVCALFIIAELVSIGLDLAIAMFAIFVLVLCLYFAVAADDGMVLLLSALCCGIGLPFLMPVAAGLTRKVNSAVPVGFGVLICYLMKIMGGASLKTTAETSDSSMLTTVMNQALANKEMFTVIVISVATVCVVYYIRRIAMDYAWLIAILFGMLLQLLLTIVANFVLALHMSMLTIFVGFIFSALLCLVLTFFAFNLDYRRVENVQFEDDEYYYYVKAVPKVSMAPKNKQEKVINAARRRVRIAEDEEEEEEEE